MKVEFWHRNQFQVLEKGYFVSIAADGLGECVIKLAITLHKSVDTLLQVKEHQYKGN